MDGKTLSVNSWKIRSFQAEDLQGLAALAEISAASPQASQFSGEDYQGIARVQGGMLLLCESGRQICGFLAGRQVADEAEILNLAVHPTVRRLGIASALLDASLTEFASKGIASVFLEVRESNTPAIALYEKSGFSISRRRKAYYRDPLEDGLCLMRKLTVRES